MKKITPFYRVCAYTDITSKVSSFMSEYYIHLITISLSFFCFCFASRYHLFFLNFSTLSFSLVSSFLNFNFFFVVILSLSLSLSLSPSLSHLLPFLFGFDFVLPQQPHGIFAISIFGRNLASSSRKRNYQAPLSPQPPLPSLSLSLHTLRRKSIQRH